MTCRDLFTYRIEQDQAQGNTEESIHHGEQSAPHGLGGGVPVPDGGKDSGGVVEGPRELPRHSGLVRLVEQDHLLQ